VRISFYAPDGTEVGFRDMRRGEIFGEIAAIDGQTRSASVVALTDVRLGSLRAEAFRDLLRSHPALAETVMRRLARLVRALSDRVVEFSTLAVSNRIHAELLRLARENMMGDHAYVDPAPGHALLASRVSTHREAVTREIKRLAADGILKKSGRALIIRDLAALETLVHRPLGSAQVGTTRSGDRPSKRAASTGRRRSDSRPVILTRS
jgi:CRP-like cAMP-binding protein